MKVHKITRVLIQQMFSSHQRLLSIKKVRIREKEEGKSKFFLSVNIVHPGRPWGIFTPTELQ